MVITVGVRELRLRLSALLRRVQAGDTVEVTSHGAPVARIVPLAAGHDAPPRVPGSAAGQIELLPGFDEVDGEIERLLLGP